MAGRREVRVAGRRVEGDHFRLDEGRFRNFGRQDAGQAGHVDDDRPAEGGQRREGDATDATEEDNSRHDEGGAGDERRAGGRQSGSHGQGEGVADQVDWVEEDLDVYGVVGRRLPPCGGMMRGLLLRLLSPAGIPSIRLRKTKMQMSFKDR